MKARSIRSKPAAGVLVVLGLGLGMLIATAQDLPAQQELPVTQQQEPPVTQQQEPPVTQQQELVPVTQQELPVTQQESVPATQQESVPVTQQESVPVAQQELVPVTQQESVPVTQQESVPVAQQESVPVAQQESVPVTQQQEPVPVAQQQGPPPLDDEQEPCSSEQQVIHCGQLPVGTESEQADYRDCCNAHKPLPLALETEVVVKAAAAAAAQQVPRPDLDLTTKGTLLSGPLNFFYKPVCPNTRLSVAIPVFPSQSGGSGSGGTGVTIASYSAPLLDQQKIQSVKATAIARLTAAAGLHPSVKTGIRSDYYSLRSSDSGSGFVHPAQVGTAELSAMKHRLLTGSDSAPLQSAALSVLLTGDGVPPKLYPGKWFPPTDTPLDYPGPYPAAKLNIKYGGITADTSKCPPNYPSAAPKNQCGHISLVELDGQMAYKQALAYKATGDTQFAANAFRIVNGWAALNTEITPVKENAPLEAGWAIAAMAKALELLRDLAPQWQQSVSQFKRWVDGVMMPAMDEYIDNISGQAIQKGPNIYGNWHSTMAEAYMAYALLTDDTARYTKAVELFQNTVADYLRWGRGSFEPGRVIGECTETLRDIYHSEFGLGGLLQVAEMAWQQDQDLYSASDFALAAAMELHARIINAWDNNKDESLLPPSFRWFENMPKPPAGTEWRFNITSQLWYAMNTKTFAKVLDLTDGIKYLVGVKFLPTGWELGYNHYTGRLGIPMPETAALLKQHNPDWHEFHWGLGTVATADTAAWLWRIGVTHRSMCRH